MKKHWFINIICTFIAVFTIFSLLTLVYATDTEDEFPQENAWYKATPSVVWDNDPEDVTTLEVHIVGREDVKRVWLTRLGSSEQDGQKELFDDGTHGDKIADDNVFALAGVLLSGYVPDIGYSNWCGFLRVELVDGTLLGNNYGMKVGVVSQEYRNVFPVQDFGDGLSATPYAFFIQDSSNQIFGSYPVSDNYCGKEYYQAAQKLYDIFPDMFDFVSIMSGMLIFDSDDFAENVPYHVRVSNNIQNIGIPVMDNTDKYGSAGRLKSVVYHSFGSNQIMDHEIGHAWGAYIGKELGVTEGAHWNKMIDVQGQMGSYYFEGDNVGHFTYNGDETWRLVSNISVEPYSPLELYTMGLIPSSGVPDMHVLTNPDFSDAEHITAKTFKTITMEQIVANAGGERIPSSVDSQKEFNLAFVVAQDLPFNDAAYAYFSLISQELMSRQPPRNYSSLAPFYWATGGRATLNTYLGDYGVLNIMPTATPTLESTAVPTLEPTSAPTTQDTMQPKITASTETAAPEPDVLPMQGIGGLSAQAWLIICVLAAVVVVLLIVFMVKRKRNS